MGTGSLLTNMRKRRMLDFLTPSHGQSQEWLILNQPLICQNHYHQSPLEQASCQHHLKNQGECPRLIVLMLDTLHSRTYTHLKKRPTKKRPTKKRTTKKPHQAVNQIANILCSQT